MTGMSDTNSNPTQAPSTDRQHRSEMTGDRARTCPHCAGPTMPEDQDGHRRRCTDCGQVTDRPAAGPR